MPQHGHKKPFSAKQKKKQLQAKRERKKQNEDWTVVGTHSKDASESIDDNPEACASDDVNVKKINHQPEQKREKGYDPNRYRLHFQGESKKELVTRKAQARVPFTMVSEDELEINMDDIYQPGSVLDMPKRPEWDYSMSKEKVLAREERHFREYLENILEKYSSEDLSYMELNLETWRQLWRVLEMADIILLITDIRHPALHFSPALYDYVTKDLKKHLILVLNKIDLAPPALVIAWKHYLKQKCPDVQIVMFTSFPKDTTGNDDSTDPGQVLHKVRRQKRFLPVGPRELHDACETLVQGKVDLSTWREKIDEDLSNTEPSSHLEQDYHLEEPDNHFVKHEQYKDGILTIGCCGYPNVGKSSLMNGLVGKKVVSVSRTPGHTKHFQTIFLTKTVKLCDSPGLVFPSLIPKPMQILAGIYPIAQVREPYSAVAYLAQRLNLPKILKIKHPDLDQKEPKGEAVSWSAMEICEEWAIKRGFLTAKAARPDVYRAANSILRMAVTGRLCLCMRPPNYTAQRADWEKHAESLEISRIQLLHRKEERESEDEDLYVGSESEEDEDDISDDDELMARSYNPFAALAEK